MNDLPQPLTPADCDLRDFPYMPLDVLRLRDSDIAARTTGEEFRCAVLLWCAAWHQVPSGSLPDDDVNLAQYAGFGRAIDQWLQHKEGAMRGWIKCTDGRLYHAVVAEKANEAWQQKHVKAHEKLGERIRKRNKLRAEKGLSALEIPDVDNWISLGCPLERVLFPEEFGTPSAGKDASFRRKTSNLPPEDSGKSSECLSETRGNKDGDSAVRRADESDSADFADSSASQAFSAGNDKDFRRKGHQIPPENALKGTEQNGTERRVNNIGSNDGSGTSSRAHEIDGVLTAAGISSSLIGWERERGKAARNITPSQQQVIDLAAMKVSAEELRKAYEMAVADRDATGDVTAINAGFVRAMVDKVRRPKPAPREDNSWKRSDAGIERKASELGIVCPAGRDYNWLREKCESVLRERANQPHEAAA